MAYCYHCNNTGMVNCYCGGDLCVCENYGEMICPACHGECDDEDYDFDCATCKGTGTVNPLTAPKDFFCAGVADCPHCDGTGRL